MFEVVEAGTKVSKDDYDKRVPDLRTELLNAQFQLQKMKIPMLIIISGVEASGKGDVVNRLNSWLDTRYIETHVFNKQSDEESNRPEYWRYWRVLPGAGDIGIYFGSWYTNPIIKRVNEQISQPEFDTELNRMNFMERMLTRDGYIVAKFWMHISEQEQKSRLKALEKNELTKWRVTKTDWEYHSMFKKFAAVSERAIRTTDTAGSSWHVIDASQDRYRDLAVMEILLQKMKNAIEKKTHKENGSTPNLQDVHEIAKPVNILSRVDLTQEIDKKNYKDEYDKLYSELTHLAWQCHQKEISSIFVFEGWDAAGKGGAIRRLISTLDAKIYRVIQIAAPSDEEKAHHYLWRFWRHIPKDGRITIYDRSWYGRVLVERIEGFCSYSEWNRGYNEINEFEQQLNDHGTIINKFWMHISKEEQYKRFKEREQISYKKHKITDEDWRNREQWDLYQDAVHDMIARTSTEYAPWHIVAGNDKNFGRLQVLRTIRDSLLEALAKRK